MSPSSHILILGTLLVWLSGVPHALGSTPMLVPILRTLPIFRKPAESFAADSTDDSGADAVVDANEKGGEALWAGSRMGPVTGFQTNSCVVFAGGIQLFSDKYARKGLPSGTPSGNSQFRDVAAGFSRKAVRCVLIRAGTFREVIFFSTPNCQ
ncbi:uncharacterized protein EDB91DRAFT_117660 [Suillus paluster]|uniref:uncharacterized protein n=1 Tax=Suillus paluster TaxID=48578 RepID=UPI001B85F27A|nr:uncharacterized protein EDB91DRAFT_117660 [Suillus paluster]KAG1725005.1 hypothetical protein EDB91DRAFT_117660 [Suillus paluster]